MKNEKIITIPADEKGIISAFQIDGISVKEKIIRFFESKLGRKNAEDVYMDCENILLNQGIEEFDQAIDIVCDELNLDAKILENDINNNSI